MKIKNILIIITLFVIIIFPKVNFEKIFLKDPIYVYKYDIDNKIIEKINIDKNIAILGEKTKFYSVEMMFNEFKKLNPIIKDVKLNDYKITYQKNYYNNDYYTAMYLDIDSNLKKYNLAKEEEKLLLESLGKTILYRFDNINRLYINVNGKPYESSNYSFKYKVAFLTESDTDFSKFELDYKYEKNSNKSFTHNSSYDYSDTEKDNDNKWNNTEKMLQDDMRERDDSW